MPPCLIYGRPASVDINIRHVDIRSGIIDPARPIPAMIDYVVAAPVKVHAQPASNCQTKTVGDEGRRTLSPAIFIYNGNIILGNIHILWLSRNYRDVFPVDNDLLVIVTLQIADVFGLPPETLD
jgi:hypothetical protein